MSKSKVVWGVVAGLLLLGLGWWLFGRTDAEPSAELGDRQADTPQLAARREHDRPPRLELAGEAKAAISGTVRERGGGPLAGARVCAFVGVRELRGLGDGLPSCTLSGADGRYRLEGLWPIDTTIDASAAGYRPGRWQGPNEREDDSLALRPGELREGVDIELLPGGAKISGVVKDISGGEIEGALVSSGDGGFNFGAARAVARTDEDGRFTLWTDPGALSLRAYADGYAPAATRVFSPSEQAELFLTPESVLVGRVVHAQTGEPVADVVVEANSANRFGRGTGSDAARSDADGNFRVRGLQPGTYKPQAHADNFYGEAAVQVHLGLGQTSEPIEIRVHPVALVEGRIVKAGTDQGCSEGSVRLTKVGSNERSFGETDEQGHVLIRSVLPGEYEVSVGCEDMVPEPEYPKLTVGSEDLVDLVWEVREGLAIRGVVVDAHGQPVSGVTVSTRMKVDPNDARAQTTSSWAGESEDDGSFELTGLLAGTYELSARGERPSSKDPLEVELGPGADRNDVRLELPASGSIRGRVVDERGVGQANVQVVAGPLGKRKESQTRTDDAGNFELEHVRTGEVRVMASADRWGQGMRRPGSTDDDEQGEVVEVADGGTVEVELLVESRAGVIRGTVVDESGAPVDDAFVAAERIPENAGANASRSRTMLRWGWSSEPQLSEADGSFTLEGLAPGSYLVRANRKGGGEGLVEGVALGSTIEVTITATGVLAGVVRVESGAVPDSFTITANDDKAGLHFRDSYFRTDGRWELHELPPGSYAIHANSAAGDGKLEAALGEGEIVDQLEIVLQSRVTIKGRLVDADSGAPIPGMTVQVVAPGGLSSPRSGSGKAGGEVSDEQGRFVVENAIAGKVSLTIMPRNFLGSSDYGWTSVARTLPNEPSVQDLGDISLIASRLKGDESPGDLGFELEQSEPGTEPEDVRLEIALVRPGGPAEAAGLVVGDVIEQVDGKSVTGENSTRYYTLVRAPEGTQLVFVLAEGRSAKLTLGKPR